MKKYKAFVVDDDPQLLEMIVEGLRLAADFDAFGYDEAERLLSDTLNATLTPQKVPDLIVADLKLKRKKMQGLELISELAERNIPSEVIAISGAYPSADHEEAIRIGAAALIPKPFPDFIELLEQMEHLAEIGLRRRVRLLNSNGSLHGLDPRRQQRPVFLSYCSEDMMLATGLRRTIEGRNIDVWYAPTTLNAGDQWRQMVEDGIDSSSVFIALLTDHYMSSGICCGELMRFYRRMQTRAGQELLLLPVVDKLSDENKRHYLLRPILERYQYVDLSRRFIDGLTILLGRIDFHLREKKRKSPPRSYQQLKHKVHWSAA